MATVPFDPSLEAALKRGLAFATDNRHEYFTLEHVLWGSLALPPVIELLKVLSVDIDSLRKNLEKKIFDSVDQLHEPGEPSWTVALSRVIRRSVEHMSNSSADRVTLMTFLSNMLDERESYATYFLESAGVTKTKIQLYASHGVAGLSSNLTGAAPAIQGQEESRPVDPLKAYAINLNARAQDRKIDNLVGRQREVLRAAQVLTRRRKNNPLLVGEPGVGKTAIAEGLAKLIVDGKAPEALSDKKIYALEMGAIVAGTKYRGEFEQRIKDVVDAVKADPDIVLFIDEIHTIIGAGGAVGAIDASNILKPALSSGELRVIGATTFQEYRTIFEKERALDRRFLKIDILEPTPAETLEILQGVSQSLEDHHKVRYTTEALCAAVELSVRYMPDKHLPDKAIDLLDEAAAAERQNAPSRRRKSIGKEQIERAVAEIARIPVGQISQDEKTGLRDLEETLRTQIFGQDTAIQALVTAVQIAKAGMNDPGKPLGSFLFAGPTGVGKTEVTKVLASSLGIPMKRFDMSEYMEQHSVARLIGAPPGYVGHDKGGGLLTDAVYGSPHCVLLLDEVEKAHPDVLNVLLQILDHGKLTDGNGRTVDFRNTLVVLTTNAGAAIAARPTMGFVQADHESDGRQALERTFSPELRNRIDEIVTFKSLSSESVAKVVDKQINLVSEQLREKGVELVVGPGARAALARDGYQPAYGARPMARLVSEKIKKPLAGKMLFGELEKGGVAQVDVDDQGNWVWSSTPLVGASISAAEAEMPTLPEEVVSTRRRTRSAP